MRLICVYILFFLLAVPAIAQAYPLDDTGFLRPAYCFHMSKAPRLEVDLSNVEKEIGQQRFFEALLSRELEFPQGEDYEAIQRRFIAWVVPRFENESTDAALAWYKDSCLSNGQ
tara:strand:- start:19 stop:360 length:342 start_codon:yes stop_codon:yes gene_type:complete